MERGRLSERGVHYIGGVYWNKLGTVVNTVTNTVSLRINQSFVTYFKT